MRPWDWFLARNVNGSEVCYFLKRQEKPPLRFSGLYFAALIMEALMWDGEVTAWSIFDHGDPSWSTSALEIWCRENYGRMRDKLIWANTWDFGLYVSQQRASLSWLVQTRYGSDLIWCRLFLLWWSQDIAITDYHSALIDWGLYVQAEGQP